MNNFPRFSILFFFTISILSTPLISTAQDCDVLFYEFAGGGEGEFQMDLTPDGGYVLAGATEDFGAVGADIQVIKVDEFGNEVWSNIYGSDLDDIATKVTTVADGYLVLGYSGEPYGGPSMAYLFKIDLNGNVLWENNYSSSNPNDNVKAYNMLIDNDGNIVIAGQRSFWGWSNLESDIIVFKTDISGTLISQNIFNFWIDEWPSPWEQPDFGNARASSIIQTSDGNYLFTGLTVPRAGYFPVEGITIIFKTDTSFNTLWSNDYYTCNDCSCQAEGIKTIEDNQGDLYLAIKSAPNGCYDGPPGYLEVLKLDSEGNYIWDQNPVFGKANDMIMASDGNLVFASQAGLVKLDLNGDLIWKKDFDIFYRTQGGNCLKETPDGGFAVSGYRGYQGVEVFIGLTDSLGNTCTNLIEGNVYYDENNNCEIDSAEAKMPQFLVELNPGPLFDLTDENGYYSFVTDTGDYEIMLHPINDLWTINCPPAQIHNVSFTEYYQTSDSTDFGLTATEICPLIEIDMAWSRARICNSGVILIDYCNFGSAAENDFQIHLNLPDEVDFLDANHPWTQTGNLYSFDIGTLDVGACGTLVIQDSISCDGILGETLCLIAEGLPDNSCGGIDPVSTDTVCRIMTNSYDPNDKIGYVNNREICFDADLDNDRIAYTIRFQNTGNDTAYRVMIVDTLSSNFDIRSIDLGSSSHSYTFEILDSNILMWIFEDINLPDSTTNNLASQGFFQFSIESTLTPGQPVENHAAIFFDANPPIITPVSEIENCAVNTLEVTGIVTNNSCWGVCDGTIDLTVAGGVGPISFYWSNLGETTEDIANLCVGQYSVTVTDSLGFEIVADFIVNDIPPLQMTYTTTSPTCGENNGTIGVTVIGGTPPYSYSWTAPSGPGCPPLPDQSDLPPGEFLIIITDAAGCTLLSSIMLEQIVPMASSIEQTNATCGLCNGAIDLTLEGGVEPYFYTWSNGETGEDLADLCAGVYELTITDADGCNYIVSDIEITEILEPDLSFSVVSQPSCDDSCNGILSVTIENGTPPFTYDWSEDWMDGQSEFDSLCSGVYNLTVVDDLGCVISESIQLFGPEALEINTSVQATCFGACNGMIDLVINGGTPPYQYEPMFDLCAGIYQISVTDANGCFVIQDAMVEELEAMEVNIDSIGNADAGLANGFIWITNSGGMAPYNFEWSINGTVVSTDQNPMGLNSGEYYLAMMDANACVENFGPFTISTTVSNYDFEKEIGLVVFPNPTSDDFKIQFNANLEKEISYSVYDVIGNKILSGFCNTLSVQTIEMRDHPSGVYFLKLKTEGFTISKKVTLVK